MSPKILIYCFLSQGLSSQKIHEHSSTTFRAILLLMSKTPYLSMMEKWKKLILDLDVIGRSLSEGLPSKTSHKHSSVTLAEKQRSTRQITELVT